MISPNSRKHASERDLRAIGVAINPHHPEIEPEDEIAKPHLWVSLIYSAVFVCLSIGPLVVRAGISTGIGLLLFLTSIIGRLFVAASVYAARLRMKELLANAPEV